MPCWNITEASHRWDDLLTWNKFDGRVAEENVSSVAELYFLTFSLNCGSVERLWTVTSTCSSCRLTEPQSDSHWRSSSSTQANNCSKYITWKKGRKEDGGRGTSIVRVLWIAAVIMWEGTPLKFSPHNLDSISSLSLPQYTIFDSLLFSSN